NIFLPLQVSVEADQCHPAVHNSTQLQNRTGPWSVHITAFGSSQSVKLEISVDCECDCTKHKQDDSPECNGRGTLQCGMCRCRAPYVGRRCETDMEPALPNDRWCHSHPDGPACSNNGTCVDGVCECRVREIPEERFSGQYCECSNFLCPRYGNRLCGGHGQCLCDRCVCDEDWVGEDCSCYQGTENCMAKNQQLCNGRGTCKCGTCICHDTRYFGPTCEIWGISTGVCPKKAECVECLAFGTGLEKAVCEEQCSDLQVTMVDSQEELTGRHCKMMDHSHRCFMYYSFPEMANSNNVTIWRNRECSPY
ncbi:integrin beta-1-B-like, partial [Nelusetta ayraudi]|uniref:integrin beta-1-B-like n=1 Tax=Nelusetta ayraudi TaxID=303726 RepID=UPI003F70FDE4